MITEKIHLGHFDLRWKEKRETFPVQFTLTFLQHSLLVISTLSLILWSFPSWHSCGPKNHRVWILFQNRSPVAWTWICVDYKIFLYNHLTLTRIAIIKKTHNKYKDVEKLEYSYPAVRHVKRCSFEKKTLENNLFLKILKSHRRTQQFHF